MVSPNTTFPHASLTKAVRVSVAVALSAVALANVLTLFLPRPWPPIIPVKQAVDLDAIGAGREGGMALAALLLLVARALMRGKRQAWLLAAGLLAFSIGNTVASRQYAGYTTIAILGLLGLLALAPLFSTRSDPRALTRGYVALGVCLACYLGHDVLAAAWGHSFAVSAARIGPPMRMLLLRGLRSLLFLFLGYGVFETLRPVLRARRSYRDERRLAGAIIRRHGAATSAHFALGPGLSYFFSPSDRSVLAYYLSGGVALILGDPIGPEEEVASLLLGFLRHCHDQDWAFAAYLASPRVQGWCRAWGLATYQVGEEALIDAASFTTVGKIGAPVRHAAARARRDGVTVRCWQGEPLPEDVFEGMHRVAKAWLRGQGGSTQMGFSMGRFPADWSEQLLTAVALDRHGEVQAFLTWTPLYRGNGWSLDNMRRLPETTPGTVELLIAECIEWACVRGYERMSLGLAPLAGLEGGAHAALREEAVERRLSVLERGAAYLYRRKLLLGTYASLHAFKAKFQPTWEPRYLVAPDAAAVPRVLAALMHAHGYSWRRAASEAVLPVVRLATRRRPAAVRAGNRPRRATARGRSRPPRGRPNSGRA